MMKQMAFADPGPAADQMAAPEQGNSAHQHDQGSMDSLASLLLGADDEFLRRFDTPLLSCEGRMLAYVLSHEDVSVKELMLNTPVSSRTFFQRLKFLRENGVLVESAAASDRRVKNLKVSPLIFYP